MLMGARSRSGEGMVLDPQSAPVLPLGSAVAMPNVGTAPTLPLQLRGAAVPAPGQPVLSCGRFGAVEDNAGALRLYTVQVPHKRERRPPPCYLTKWDGRSFLPLLTRPCGSEVVSCLSVRYGAGLGAGTGPCWPPLTVPLPPQRLGHVPGAGHRHGLCGHPHCLLAAGEQGRGEGCGGCPAPRAEVTGPPSLLPPQRLYYVKEAHGIVVTDVAFVPESQRGRELLAGNEAALLSVAVDSRCKLHLLPGRRRWRSSCTRVRSGAAAARPACTRGSRTPGHPPQALLSSAGSLPVWLLLLLCAGLIVATILLLQLAFPGFL